VVVRSKAHGRWIARIAGSNLAGGRGCVLIVNVVCWYVEVFATGRSLVQRFTMVSGVSEFDCEA
jgi:hypothetical protein